MFLSFALVTSVSFPAKSTSVLFWLKKISRVIHGSATDCVGEPSETDGESVGCGTSCSSAAENAKQSVEIWPAGVDVEEIGTLPMFSGDNDLSERTDSMSWSQWSLTIPSYFGKFNQTTAWMLQQVKCAWKIRSPLTAQR